MLKRLELVGFKSFADKTQFEFARGITAIVGPNGSGKSNIVDAVRWVLGEQSAKSLRGGEMADVIFNGSTSRRGLGMAEVTMTFDNSRNTLATDASEVQITRRVYRDGEGEYLINHQASRLKDIRELFLGSGAGADAYCIIEQGRVDVLLQASTKERRTIFEEAAGISRFKAKKIEALRKLERVDQNLQRLQDIVDEVEKQLRSVKLQAAKALRYQEYSNRLKELRVALGLREYHQLAEELAGETTVLLELRAELDQRTLQADACEAETRRLEDALGSLDAAVHDQEVLLSQARQQIATEQTTSEHEAALSVELESAWARLRDRATDLATRVGALADGAAQAARELEGVEGQCREQGQALDLLDRQLQTTAERLGHLHDQVPADKAQHLELMRQAAHLRNDAVSYRAQVDNLRRERDRLLHKSAQAAEHLASIDLELQQLAEADASLQAQSTAARQKVTDHRQEQERLRRLQDETVQAVSSLHAERSGLASRIEILEGLERSQEGLGTGVRELLALLGQADPGPWRTVAGLVADVLSVRREFAPLIDLALGDRAQRFVVRDLALLEEALRTRLEPFSGRVGFLPLAPDASEEEAIAPVIPEGATAHAGIVAVAQEVARCENHELTGLPAQLLGRTLIVRDIVVARELAALGGGFRFVTVGGELLEADGTLTIGTHHAETGILSRKSELRELRQTALALDDRIGRSEHDLAELRERTAAHDHRGARLQEEIEILAEQAADLRTRLGQHRQRREGLHEEVELSRGEINAMEAEVLGLDNAWQAAHSQAEEAERQVHLLQDKLEKTDVEIRQQEQARRQLEQAVTGSRVALAQVEERLTALTSRQRQLEGDLAQRRQELDEAERQLGETHERREESQRKILHASSVLARLFLTKEDAEHQVVALVIARDQQRLERQAHAENAAAARNAWSELQRRVHAHELAANDLGHRRDTMVERLREDYSLGLPELYEKSREHGQWATAGTTLDGATIPPPDSLDPAVVPEEIEDLRLKLSRLGSVNLDSLQELAELETRASSLKSQNEDLASAKRSLEEIIGKINKDSRRLFAETFEDIRLHFQELFRKLFGGGMADTVLEDESDILESGIEIIARPPGKELRSISLMSGGEKTLTAVALLLAIFRSKPSPFCILDEVDAALDEANIGRFTAVLNEFLDKSHFIIITHSKRTMSVADVLYGVTMQESGISKRVAIRFEDWPEDQPQPAA
jgi:chromosome segregation protein